MSLNISAVLEQLEGVRKSTNGYMACCPAHDDRNPSLSIREGDNDGILVHCFAGCLEEEICRAINISKADLMPPSPPRRKNHQLIAKTSNSSLPRTVMYSHSPKK